MTATQTDTPSQRQLDFIASLRAERQLDPEHQAWLDQELPRADRGRASQIITRLLARPKLAEGAHRDPSTAGTAALSRARRDVPEGRYALADLDGHVRFYRVDKPDQGRWAGYTFVKRCLGSPGSLRYERISRAESDAALLRILEDGPREASLRFGRELGTCGVCGSPLTNDESRARGIGPVCAGKAGW